MQVSQVYLIRAANGLYKIGRSRDLEGRFRDLQAANATMLELVWCAEGFDLERILHRLFANVRHHSEWFALTEGNVQFILSLDEQAVEVLLKGVFPSWYAWAWTSQGK